MLGIFVFVTIFGLVVSAEAFGQQTASGAAPVSVVLDTERATFSSVGLSPIVIPQGENVGDIVDAEKGTLIAASEDCFPSLKPREFSSELPKITILTEKGLGAALGVAEVGSADGQAETKYSFILDFDHVVVKRASQYQLRTTRRKDAKECDRVKYFLEDQDIVKGEKGGGQSVGPKGIPYAFGDARFVLSGRLPPLLIGEVFYGRRIVHVQTTSSLVGGAKLSLGQKILKSLGLTSSFTVVVDASLDSSDTFDLVGQETIPVAIAPAFVIVSSKPSPDGQSTEYQFAGVDSDKVDSQIRVARAEQRSSYALVEDVLKKLDMIRNTHLAARGPHFTLTESVAEVARKDLLTSALIPEPQT